MSERPDIAALIAEATADEPSSAAADDDAPETEPAETASEADSDAADTEQAEPAGDDSERTTALLAAVDSGDVAKLLEALGDKADELLGGKAHAALRHQARENAGKLKKVETLATQLEERYGDAITVRKACETGASDAFDQFADLVEKWTGRPWNEVMRWAAKAATGRVERLEAKTNTEKAAAETKTAKQQEAHQEVMAWVGAGIKGHALASIPDGARLVWEKIKARHSAGIDTPAKAIPLVMADLRKQHEALGKALKVAPGKGLAKKAPQAAERASARDTPQRRSSIAEDIAWAKQFIPRGAR